MRLVTALVVLLAVSLAWADEAITGYAGDPSDPQAPGYHKLVYHYTHDGKKREMAFLLYLPESYAAPGSSAATQPAPASQPSGPYPMLVFMSGLGERGSDPQMLHSSGVPRELRNAPEVLQWMPMIMVGPQCPADARYEDEHIGRAITGLIDEISKRYPVDQDRRYITGFSMGGTGCWSVARYAKDRLAVYAPIVPRVFQPEVVSEALAGTGATCLVISGEVDPKSEPGSSVMAKALRERGVDVVYAMVPSGDHNLWPWYFRDKSFYEWLLSHRRGSNPPADRMDEKAIIAMASERSNRNEEYLRKLHDDLQKVAPWWQIDNTAIRGAQGFRRRANGRENVFVSLPYFYETPCRLQTTTTLPTGNEVKLRLVVGRHPEGDWRLIVRVNEQEVLTTPMDKQTAPDNWRIVEVDLTRWAGQEVRLQVCQAAMNAFRNEHAYWQKIEIVSD